MDLDMVDCDDDSRGAIRGVGEVLGFVAATTTITGAKWSATSPAPGSSI